MAISAGRVLRWLLTKKKVSLPRPNWGMNPKEFAKKVREVLWLLLWLVSAGNGFLKAFVKGRGHYQSFAIYRNRLASLSAVETFPRMRQIFFSSLQTVTSAIKKHCTLFPGWYLLCRRNKCKRKIENGMIYSRCTQQCCEKKNILALRSRCGCRKSHNFEILCLGVIKILTIINVMLGLFFPIFLCTLF